MIVTEFMENGALDSFLRVRKKTKVTVSWLILVKYVSVILFIY